jgi:hypothetical protein
MTRTIMLRKAKRPEASRWPDTCGNDYDKAFQVTMGGRTMTFDSFECAIQAMAPKCQACGCRIIGHSTDEKNTQRN